MTTEAKCKDIIADVWKIRKKDLTKISKVPITESNYNGQYNKLMEYALSFDYVEAKTFHDQPEGYHRYQISWGGPQDEIRFYDEGGIYFAYLDWYDGAEIPINQEPITEWLIKMFNLYE